MDRILVLGAVGQIGSELAMALRFRYGMENVVAGGHLTPPGNKLAESGPFEILDCTRIETIDFVVKKYRVGLIYHMAAVLSAKAEENPLYAWKVNIQGLVNVLEIARENRCSVFFPSSIGVFGPSTPADLTPQVTIQRPNTIYGVSKLTGELLSDYYYEKYGVDVRGLRFPGIVSHVTLPGGGTTDYAVEMYHQALKEQHYQCCIREGTFLDMMYMPDAIQAAISLMEVEPSCLKHRNAYNVTSMSIDPGCLSREIKKLIPEFTLDYRIDPIRQKIAESWPNSMDDGPAREDWGWRPRFDLKSMTIDMLQALSAGLYKADEMPPGLLW